MGQTHIRSASIVVDMINLSMGRALPVIGLLIVCGLSLPHLYAQSSGTVTGRVFDQTEAVIPGVSVELLFGDMKTAEATITDGSGVYRFDGVPAGKAELTFRLINFSTVRRPISV